MMCVADAVETAQGDCSTKNFLKAREDKVFSYGNRLLCEWDRRGAWFRWGNTDTYRKFFQDYQAFLRRPVEIGREVAGGIPDSNNVFIVSLDLTKFYDLIDRQELIRRLKKVSGAYYECAPDPEFWVTAEKILNWTWSAESIELAGRLGLPLTNGLPQGLASAGFFANAYLIEFDRQVGSEIGKPISSDGGITLHDYCRYVDDIRLVVSVDDGLDVEKTSSSVNKWISSLLKKHGGEKLEINDVKTKVRALADLDSTGTLSGRIAIIQSELSGPVDRDALESMQGILEGMLSVNSDGVPEHVTTDKDKALIRLARFDHDVRADTLKRFAANRLASIIRNKRRINDGANLKEGVSSPIDNESELLAKKLVWAWMQDPSLALVLRKALEIFPSPEIAEPVFDAIFRRCSFSGEAGDKITSAMADYLLADLFRSCVDFNGYFQIYDCPNGANPEALIEVACRFSQKAVSSEGAPAYVRRQALLLLAVKQKPVQLGNYENSMEHMLHAILAGKEFELKRRRVALFEVAAQITGRPESIAIQLVDAISRITEEEALSVLEDLAKRGGDFWVSVWATLKKKKLNKKILDSLRWAAPAMSSEIDSRQQLLSKIIASEKNGFLHESALIKLGLALIEVVENGRWTDGISPRGLTVSQPKSNPERVDWGDVWRLGVALIECQISKTPLPQDPRYLPPRWLNTANPDASKIYWLGAILRAASVGSLDFTAIKRRRGGVVNYKGLKTDWYKRRMGMLHAPEALVGEYSTVTEWFSELLMKCLQWPGFESNYLDNEDISKVESLSDLQGVLEARLEELNEVYCVHSWMPALITKIKRPNLKGRLFRLVCVQQVLPEIKDFSAADPRLNNVEARARNRDHLSRICNLAYKTLLAKRQSEESANEVGADLIVFAEVAVHIDDQDIIKRLADKTGAIVLAGIIFNDVDGKLVNLARWLVPDYRDSGRRWLVRDQGKAFPTANEVPLGVVGYRPCQHIIRISGNEEGEFNLSGAICYDATDLNLAADLKGKTDLFVICAHNKDVRTFDAMASALHYHMYQHVVVVNKGEFGGSTIQAPYKESFDRLIAHAHGVGQISVDVADLDLMAFKRTHKTFRKVKTKPAGI